MNIERFVADFGNSIGNFYSDNYYFELLACIAEVKKEKAEGVFTNKAEGVNDLLDRLLIKTTIDDQERYFMVGNLAEDNPYANGHIGHMHDKIKSDIPYVLFLTALAYYYKVKNLDGENVNQIEIENMKMMLPIWLLKKEDKFSAAHKKMENRFIGEHKVTLLTYGMETDLTINVHNAKCHNESEVARWALKYKLVNDEKEKSTKIEKREIAKRFETSETVLIDIGGGSTDAVKLSKGLNAPIKRESFQVIKIEPFLGRLERLLKEKLIEHFTDVRTLEKFIVDNYKKSKYILKNENTGEKFDLTAPIVSALEEYAELLIYKVMDTFSSDSKTKLEYIYFGGEAPILAPYIKEAIKNSTTEDIMERNHHFLDDVIESSYDDIDNDKEVFKPSARTVNLAALLLLSLNESNE
ncbi:hypothetical protein BTS2_3373 [Bacillus sp. TS-2]|nr:hypothetical protein BTS2_3373 [Bacillus sp. TS-2]